MNLANIHKRLFGVSQNGQCSELLKDLAWTALNAARHLRHTRGQDRPAIIAYEHKGDTIERHLHVLLDSAFILRFDKADVAHLAWELDEIIDGMRKVVTHVEVYRAHLKEMPPAACDLLECIEQMAGKVVELIEKLAGSRYDLAIIGRLVNELGTSEEKADELRFVGKGAAAREYDHQGASPVAFHAWVRLYSLLEEVTDSANHVGSKVLSMVRREA